ncbi:unnamed protein product, partial [Closterium sp. NIES-54]
MSIWRVLGEQSSGETRRSEERCGAAPRRKEDKAEEARAGGEAETWEDQRQGGGSACHEGMAGRGDQGGGATGESAITTPRRPTLSKPLTKLLGRRGLAPTLLLLSLATARTAPLNSSTPTATTPTAATTATPTAATTAATKAPTPVTTPTATTTSTTSTTSTAAPTSTPIAASTTPATLALAAAPLPTSRSSPNILSTKDAKSSSRGVGGGKGGGGTPLKEGRARSATSGTYSDYTSLSCKEVLLEEVNNE